MPRSTGGSATAGLTYSLTPQTDFGLDGTSTRTSSVIQDVYMSRAMVSLARRIGNRWFMQGRGDRLGSRPCARRTNFRKELSTHLEAWVQTSIQSFMATVDRSPLDTYGAAAGIPLVGGTSGGIVREVPGRSLAAFSSSACEGRYMRNWMDGRPPPLFSKCSGSIAACSSPTPISTNPGPSWVSPRDIEVHTGQMAFVWAERPPR